MGKLARGASLSVLALLLAACSAGDERPVDVSADTVPRVNRAPSPELLRREALYGMIFEQIEPCLTEQIERVSDPNAAGPVVVQFGFSLVGEAETARLPQGGEQRYEADGDYRELVNAILLGVRNCSPLTGMPQAEHDIWGEFPLVYRPQEARAS